MIFSWSPPLHLIGSVNEPKKPQIEYSDCKCSKLWHHTIFLPTAKVSRIRERQRLPWKSIYKGLIKDSALHKNTKKVYE